MLRDFGGCWLALFSTPWLIVPEKVSAQEGYDTGSLPAMVLLKVYEMPDPFKRRRGARKVLLAKRRASGLGELESAYMLHSSESGPKPTSYLQPSMPITTHFLRLAT